MKKNTSSFKKIAPLAGIIVWLTVISHCCGAQTLMDAYLADTVHDERLESGSALVRETDFLKPSGSVFRDMEFRYSQDNFQEDKQTYTVRVEPRGLKENSLERRRHEGERHLYQNRNEMMFRKLLLSRYATLIDGIFCQEILSIKKEMVAVYRDRVIFLEETMGSTVFEPKKYLEAYRQENDLELEIASLRDTLTLLEDRVCSTLGKELQPCFNTRGLIPIERIRRIRQDCLSIPIPENVNTRRADIEAGLADIDYEKETSRSWINFIQVSWEHDNDNTTAESLSMELGIPLPFSGSRDNAVITKKIQAKAGKSNQEVVMREEKDKSCRVMDELLKRLNSYDRFYVMCDHRDEVATSAVVQQVKTEDADVLLYLKLEKLENRARLAEMAKAVYEAYIDMMDVLGRVSGEIPVNLLIGPGGADLW